MNYTLLIITTICLLTLVGCTTEGDRRNEVCISQGYNGFFADALEKNGVCCIDDHCGMALCISFEIAQVDYFNESKYPCPEPKNLTCYNTTYNDYIGEVNYTCLYYGCEHDSQIDRDGCFSIFGELDETCFYRYITDLESCNRHIERQDPDPPYAHKWGCIINETIKVINETRCYSE